MDGEGNATVPHKLTTESLKVTTTGEFDGLVTALGDINITGSATVGGTLDVTGDVNVKSLSTSGNVTVSAPGIISGNGSGITNLPIASIGNPLFFVQSTLLNFLPGGNRFDPEAGEEFPSMTLTMQVEMFGRPPGLYYWKTDANIDIQLVYNSASGWFFWDGTKVSGQDTYALNQDLDGDLGNLNPIYFLTWSQLFFTSLTGFYVVQESTEYTIPLNPLQPTNYYINVYLILPFQAP